VQVVQREMKTVAGMAHVESATSGIKDRPSSVLRRTALFAVSFVPRMIYPFGVRKRAGEGMPFLNRLQPSADFLTKGLEREFIHLRRLRSKRLREFIFY